MNTFVIPAHSGGLNPIIRDRLTSLIPQCRSIANSDVVIVPLVDTVGYTYNSQLEEIKAHRKPYVFIDFIEYGAGHQCDTNWANRTQHLFGRSGEMPSALHDRRPEFDRLHAFIAENPPVLYFKRELLARAVDERVAPIEFPCYLPPHQPESREDFERRPIEVFYSWGFSNCMRPRIHASIWGGMCDYGYSVVGSLEHVQSELSECKPRRLWVTAHTPHYARVDIAKVMDIQGKSKTSISAPGAGIKCIRHGECPVNSVMVMPWDELAWSFPWVGHENCIRLGEKSRVAWQLNHWFANPEDHGRLYDIYRRGLDTVDRYRSHRYVNEYVIPLIKKFL